MYKKLDDRSERIKRIKQMRRRKQFFVLFLVFIFFLVSGTTLKVFASLRSKDLSPKENPFPKILENPIKSSWDEEIEKAEKLRQEAKLRELREEAKEKRRAEEAKRLEKEKNKKIAYLTFDDGPSLRVTPRILDILDDYDVKATFFVLGKMADAHPEILKLTHERGHAIGHHSFSHNYNYIYKSTENFIGELDRTNRVFEQILGMDFETKLLRFPGGSFEKSKQKFVQATEKLGYASYDWNVLNGDAEGHNLSSKTLVNRLKSSVNLRKGRKEIIILMHDTDAKSTTADSLPEIIEYLIKEGYEFRTLNQKQD